MENETLGNPREGNVDIAEQREIDAMERRVVREKEGKPRRADVGGY